MPKTTRFTSTTAGPTAWDKRWRERSWPSTCSISSRPPSRDGDRSALCARTASRSGPLCEVIDVHGEGGHRGGQDRPEGEVLDTRSHRDRVNVGAITPRLVAARRGHADGRGGDIDDLDPVHPHSDEPIPCPWARVGPIGVGAAVPLPVRNGI